VGDKTEGGGGEREGGEEGGRQGEREQSIGRGVQITRTNGGELT
jgi:hypothetical protein